MKRFSKAQAATEYLLITGFVMMIILPLIYIVINYAQESGGEVAEAQLQRIGRQIMENAENIFYFGEPSKITLDVNMPEGVRSMTIHTNDPATGCVKCTELRFLLQKGRGKQDIVFSTSIPLNISQKDSLPMGTKDLDVCIFDAEPNDCGAIGDICPGNNINLLSTSKVYPATVNILDPHTVEDLSFYMAYTNCPGTWNLTINDVFIENFVTNGTCDCGDTTILNPYPPDIDKVRSAWKQKEPNSVKLIFDGDEIHVNTIKMNFQYSTPSNIQTFNSTVYSPGFKRIRLQAKEDYVEIGTQ